MADLMQCLRCGLGYARLPADGRCHACGAAIRPVNADLMQQARELLAAEYAMAGSTKRADKIIAGFDVAPGTEYALCAIAAALRAAPEARPLDEWHEDMGAVTWWRFPVEEAAWIGTPLDSDWPGYHTHWTPHPAIPAMLAARPQGVKDAP